MLRAKMRAMEKMSKMWILFIPSLAFASLMRIAEKSTWLVSSSIEATVAIPSIART